jgi:hypothetical protein
MSSNKILSAKLYVRFIEIGNFQQRITSNERRVSVRLSDAGLTEAGHAPYTLQILQGIGRDWSKHAGCYCKPRERFVMLLPFAISNVQEECGHCK